VPFWRRKPTVEVPRVPAWRAPLDGRTFTAMQVRQEIQRLTTPFTAIDTTDATFAPLSHEWFTEALDWSWHFAKATGLAYTPESFDCDKFSLALALAANIAAGRAGVKAQPLLARIHVNNLVPWAGVRDGAHALNAAMTDRGLFVVEPQNRTTAPLADYPNRAQIFRVKLGG
jgi:hypothetical protein